MAMYLSSDMIKDGMPLPSASNVPLITTEIAETINPALMMRRATAPCSIVCGVSVNMSINCLGIAKQRIVPITITPRLSSNVTLNMPITLSFRPAPSL